jgi:four helix bundle protein
MQNHAKLFVWQRAHALTVEVHRASREVSGRRSPGLVPQLLRACASIPANIAEGAGQETGAQFARFLTIAIASANETENHLVLVRDLDMLSHHHATPLITELCELRRMMLALRKRVLERIHDNSNSRYDPLTT